MWSIVNYVIILRGVVGKWAWSKAEGLTWPLVLRIFGMVSITFFFCPPLVHAHNFNLLSVFKFILHIICIHVLSGKPVTAGTQRSSEEPHVDESLQGDNERCLHAYACIGMHKHKHVIVARDQTSLEPVYHRSPIKPPFECSCESCTS